MKIKETDSKLHVFYSDPDIASDIFNAYFFEGEEMIKAYRLHPLDTKEEHKQRDIAFQWIHENHNIILCIELQSTIDSDMPTRIMGYDSSRYKNTDNIERKYPPVITLILYTGEKRWIHPRRLKDRVRKDILDDYVNDYPLYIMQIRDQYKFKHKILNVVFEQSRWIYGHKTDEEVNETVVSYEEAELIFQHTGYEGIFENIKQEEEYRMCELFDYLLNKGEQKGLKQGEIIGKQEGIVEGKQSILQKLKELEKQGYSLSDALKVLS